MPKNPTRRDRLQAAVSAEYARLYEMLDRDPAAAIAEARRVLLRQGLGLLNTKGLCAAVLIDAGTQVADAAVVEEGVVLLREIESSPTTPAIALNVANGLVSLAALRGRRELGLLDTSAGRQEARMLFQQAAEGGAGEPKVRSSSLTNLANQLKDSYRWIEAYDGYVEALESDPTNAIALSGVSSLLRWRTKHGVSKEGPLRRAAVRYLLRARLHLAQAHRYAGPRGVARIEELLREFGIAEDEQPPNAEPAPASAYAAFVRRHRLALCVAPESIGAVEGFWDHLPIGSVTQAIDSGPDVPVVFATWNLLKADYLAARWLAHAAMDGVIPETGAYSDTLDYANYGARYSGIVLAQKAALDVLDKVAAAATDYFGLSGDPQQVHFTNRWHVRHPTKRSQLAEPLAWDPDIASEIEAGNTSLIALAELALDYGHGHLRPRRNTRNAGTHRFVVLHDERGEGRAAKRAIVDRYPQAAFQRILIGSLQVARAALFYFREAVGARERRLRRATSGPLAQLYVPSHAYVRGEDDAGEEPS
jgi:LA2681-like HEPN